MNRRTNSALGALHPILFFSLVYVVVLMLSIVVCSSIFYSCSASSTETIVKEQKNNPGKTETHDYNTAVAALK